MRDYNREIPIEEEGFGPELFTLEEWMDPMTSMCFNEYDGSAYWMKNGRYSNDSAFHTEPLDATGVIFFGA
jgi:hypothetical protein